MIIHTVCRRLNASEAAASHCVVGIDWIAPRTISETFAITGNARPSVAFVQSGMGIVTPNAVTWNGNRNMQYNSSTSHGALRKTCVATNAPFFTGGSNEIWALP